MGCWWLHVDLAVVVVEALYFFIVHNNFLFLLKMYFDLQLCLLLSIKYLVCAIGYFSLFKYLIVFLQFFSKQYYFRNVCELSKRNIYLRICKDLYWNLEIDHKDGRPIDMTFSWRWILVKVGLTLVSQLYATELV